MKIGTDYRMNIHIALSVLKQQREQLIEDSVKHRSGIYLGLHESESPAVRAVYYDAYRMEWLDTHWTVLSQKICEKTKSEERDITLLFAAYFQQLYSSIYGESDVAKVVAPDLLKAEKEQLQRMIRMADEWEENKNQLEVNLKKHKEYYKKKLEALKKKSEV